MSTYHSHNEAHLAKLQDRLLSPSAYPSRRHRVTLAKRIRLYLARERDDIALGVVLVLASAAIVAGYYITASAIGH